METRTCTISANNPYSRLLLTFTYIPFMVILRISCFVFPFLSTLRHFYYDFTYDFTFYSLLHIYKIFILHVIVYLRAEEDFLC